MWETQQWTNHLGKVEIPIKMVMDSPGAPDLVCLVYHMATKWAWQLGQQWVIPKSTRLSVEPHFCLFHNVFFWMGQYGTHGTHAPFLVSTHPRFYFKLSTPNAGYLANFSFSRCPQWGKSPLGESKGSRIRISNFWPCNGPPKFRLLQICEVIICQLICPIISVNMSVRRCVAVFPACQVCEHQMPVENSKVIFGQGLDPKRGWFNHIFDRQVQWFFLVRLSIYDIYIYILFAGQYRLVFLGYPWLSNSYGNHGPWQTKKVISLWFWWFSMVFPVVGISVIPDCCRGSASGWTNWWRVGYERHLVMQILVREYMNYMNYICGVSWNGGTPKNRWMVSWKIPI